MRKIIIAALLFISAEGMAQRVVVVRRTPVVVTPARVVIVPAPVAVVRPAPVVVVAPRRVVRRRVVVIR